MPAFDAVNVGDHIPGLTHTIEQDQLIRYAGASGDFNPLHWDPQVAAKVSPTGGIIAHGMFTMGLLSRVVTEWAGGAEHIRKLSASFRAPCPVGATMTFGGEVLEVDEHHRTATLAVWAELEDGSRVVDRKASRAVVSLQ